MAEVGLELGEDTVHVEECLASCIRSVQWLFGGGAMGAFLLEHRDNDLNSPAVNVPRDRCA